MTQPPDGGPDRSGQSPSSTLLLGSADGALRDGRCVGRMTPTDPPGENLLFVTYGQTLPVDDLVGRWDAVVGTRPAALGIIGVGETTRSTTAPAAGPEAGGAPPLVTTITDPTDLTALGSAIITYLDEWAADDRRTMVCFNSLTALLEHVGPETAFRFLHLLTTYLERTGSTAHFHLDASGHRDTTVETFRDLVDRVLDAPSEGAEDDHPPSPDVVTSVLRSSRRRVLLESLRREPGPVAVETLAREVAAREADVPVGTLSEEEIHRVHVSLHHHHLPKLSDHGIVAVYDGTEVELLEDGHHLLSHVDAIDDPEF